MKTVFYLTACIVVFTFIGSGCIPSTPTGQKPGEMEASPQATTPVPPPVIQEKPTTASPEAAVSPPESTTSSEGKSAVQIPLGMNEIPAGALALPVVSLVPIKGKEGYEIKSRFPVEGLSMEGTLLHQSSGKWLLSGQFKSNIESFNPGQPAMQKMGAMASKEGGGLQVVENSSEIIIVFSAAMPSPDVPKLPEPKVIPFNLSLEAPDEAIFSIMLAPF